MSRKVKIALASALQLGLIASIGSFVGWPYMGYVLKATFVAILLTIIFFIYDMAKD